MSEQYYRTVPVSEPPKENGKYVVINDLGYKRIIKYEDGQWLDFDDDESAWYEVGEDHVTHYLSPTPPTDPIKMREALERISELSKLAFTRQRYGAIVDIARESLQNTGDGWVRVEERLPETGKSILMYWKNELGNYRISKGFYAAKFSVEDDCEENHDGYSEYSEEKDKYYYPEGWVETGWEIETTATVKGVTHWRPLPSPPNK